MVPKIDEQIGILCYTTSFEGCGGRIRESEEDFVVSEVLSERSLKQISEDSGYAIYKLTKRRIDTNHALDNIWKSKHIRLKAFGLKDANAITEQYVCAMNQGKAINDYATEKYTLKKLGYVKKQITKKSMIGNSFKIKISGCSKNISKFSDFDNVLNFYGYQRFGSKRPVTHLVGKALLQKNYAKAVDLFLSFTTEYDSQENQEIRNKLADKTNFASMLNLIPKQMDFEKILLKEMMESGDPKKSIKQLPLNLRRLFVQAYQAFLFNKTLSKAYDAGENLFSPQEGDVCYDLGGSLGKFTKGLNQNLAVPIVGYAYFKKTRFDYYVSRILEEEEISPKDFILNEMQEIANEGGFRHASIQCSDASISENTVSVTLSRGSFATILLREIMKPKDPLMSGF